MFEVLTIKIRRYTCGFLEIADTPLADTLNELNVFLPSCTVNMIVSKY